MRIIDLPADDEAVVQQMAALLVDGFRTHWPNAWPTLEAALGEVHAMAAPEHILRIAVNNNEQRVVLGWVGGQPSYCGHVWELHPLVVRADQQGQGIGRALVLDLEAQVRERGGLTIMLGTDDEDNMTTLANADLYTNLWEQIARIRSLRRHPYEFYQKLGYTIIGVVPDANGRGKPDILMAKRVE